MGTKTTKDTTTFIAEFAAATWDKAMREDAANPYWDNACRSLPYFEIAFKIFFGRKPTRVEANAYQLDLLERNHAALTVRGRDCLGFIYRGDQVPHMLQKARQKAAKAAKAA